ncbi:MAG TPA: paraquat-inducible protein A [Rhodospirillales bacterium]|nr:paraquat-inducible protein A [Rhodospirillales bacterium]
MSIAPLAPSLHSPAATLIRCHECDLLQQLPPLPSRGAIACPRCGSVLLAAKPERLERALVLYLTALILLIIANAFPFLTMKVQGLEQSSHLLSGAIDLYRQGMWEVSVAVVLFVFVFPLLKIVTGLLVVGPLAYGRGFPGAEALYRLFDRLHPWAMTEIFLLGVLVAYTKLIDLATVELGPSLYAFLGLIVALIAADSTVDPHQVWERLRAAAKLPVPDPALRRRLVGCHTCQLTVELAESAHGAEVRCPRCGSSLHRRKPDSLARTAALLVTAAVLYIPANLYPVMTLTALGSGEPSTIIGGVIELVEANMWPLALIVFVASILVPMLKLISMSWLVISVHTGSRWRLKDRTLIYRLNELVGRWSMVDVFVVSILVALVQLGSLAQIVPGMGILAFASVVVLTMVAALSFDPRLMWDRAGANDEG